MQGNVVDRVRSALKTTPSGARIVVAVDAGDLAIEGEVASVAEKKRALGRAGAVPGVDAIVDRLHVRPTVRRDDASLFEDVRRVLQEEPLLGDCCVHPNGHEPCASVLFPEGCAGDIFVSVREGVVTLDGDVPSLADKRIAGVLAWHVPGCRDVVNGLDAPPVEPHREEEELAAAVQLALARAPGVEARRVRIRARGAAVALEGRVPSEAVARLCEDLAWSVFGVDAVENFLISGTA